MRLSMSTTVYSLLTSGLPCSKGHTIPYLALLKRTTLGMTNANYQCDDLPVHFSCDTIGHFPNNNCVSCIHTNSNIPSIWLGQHVLSPSYHILIVVRLIVGMFIVSGTFQKCTYLLCFEGRHVRHGRWQELWWLIKSHEFQTEPRPAFVPADWHSVTPKTEMFLCTDNVVFLLSFKVTEVCGGWYM